MVDCRDSPKAQQRADPLWKVRVLIDHLNKQAKDMWVPGKSLAIDEQTIGFQGASGMKLRISYKRKGDGFQCDAVCDRGYTFSFWFRHGPPPDMGPEMRDLALSPLASCVVWLARRLPNKWTRVYMDNLFNSVKLFTALYRERTLAHGVVRTHGRGLPDAVIQREEKNVKRAESLRGTTKAARMQNNPACPDILAMSVYDTKPVHMLSTVAESVVWTKKTRKVWDGKAKTEMAHLRLNVIDDYNSNMNGTDVADQLRGVYRPDHWMRNRKWWWSYFTWALGVASVNAYKIYGSIYDDDVMWERVGLPRKWTHAEFLQELVFDLLLPEQSKKHVSFIERNPDDTMASSVALSRMNSLSATASEVAERYDADLSCESGRKTYLQQRNPYYITKDRMTTGFFKDRLDGLKHHWCHALQGAACQYCAYVWNNEMDKRQKKGFAYKHYQVHYH